MVFYGSMEKTTEQIEYIRLYSRITKRFHKACADYGLIANGDHILVGLSGGKDSLALVELLGKRAKVYVPKFKVSAVYVQIKERAYQSNLSYLQEFCESVDVPFIVKQTEISTPQNLLEDNRLIHKQKDSCFLCSWYRRKTLFETAQELGCNKIALGHHKNDIVETFLMNLIFQGNIGTITPLLNLDKMPIQMIRPLCLIEEKDLIRFAELSEYHKQTKLCPFEKKSNRTNVKKILNQLQILNPNVLNSIFGAMENIKTDYLPHKVKL